MGVNDDEWVAAAIDLARVQAQSEAVDPTSLRIALGTTALLMARAPTRFTDAYSRLSEVELAQGGLRVQNQLEQDDWTWTVDAANAADLVKDIGCRARGLDAALAHAVPFDGPPDDVDRAYYCPEADAYVIPRHGGVETARPKGGRMFFLRRGTPLHRVVPKRLGSFTTRLHALDDLDSSLSTTRSLGAAMFEEFELKLETDGGSFKATGIVCPSAKESAAAHVDAGRAACIAIVWPELTMPPEIVQSLADKLSSDALGPGATGALQWVLAGSWHQGDPVKNLAPILDAYGNLRFEYAKSILYRDGEHGIEAALEGYVVPILVTERSLVAFGICRDFCELVQGTPYPELGVDLVVVPSMGEETTIRSHRTAAHLISVAGERAFVVQQRQRTGRGKTGWVLPPIGDPSTLEPDAMLAGSWSEHRWDRDD